MSREVKVEVIGFNATERLALGSMFGLSRRRSPSFVEHDHAGGLTRPDMFLVDADAPSAMMHLARVNPSRSIPTVLVGQCDGDTGWPLLARPMHWTSLFQALDGALAATPPGSAPIALAPTVTNPPLLIVDDSESVCSFLRAKLERLGFKIDCVPTAQAAIDRMAAVRFRWVFVDASLPGVDGYQLCRTIKSDRLHANTPVVMLVSRRTGWDRVKALLAGCDAYLAKPIEEGQFRRVMARLSGRPYGAEGEHTATQSNVRDATRAP